MDRADESWYFYLNEEEGWRLRVLDAAAGSRYYVMDHTKDGGSVLSGDQSGALWRSDRCDQRDPVFR